MSVNRIIDRTNRFYIEMSRKVISKKEYDILQQLLIDKKSLQEVAVFYEVSSESIRRIYERVFSKVKCLTEILSEIDHYKEVLEELKNKCHNESCLLPHEQSSVQSKLQRAVYDSHFPFSKRMYNIFEALQIRTIEDLVKIPLKDFQCFRGFKVKLKKELVSYIEFENIEHLFEDFSRWKKI